MHQVRWLSFANCITNVCRTIVSLLKSLLSDSEDDPMAESLFQALSSYKFLFLTHFFSDIMADIAMVSQTFQARDVSYSDLNQTLTAVCDSIEQQYLIQDTRYVVFWLLTKLHRISTILKSNAITEMPICTRLCLILRIA